MNDSPAPVADPGAKPTILAALVQHIVTNAATGGMPSATLLAASGLDPQQLTDPNGRIPVSVVERLVCSAVDNSADPLLGLHFSESTEPAGFGVTGYILQACSTVQEVIELSIRYERLISDIGQTSLRFQPGMVLWCWDCKTENAVFRRHATDYILSCYRTIYLRWVKPPTLPILSVYLAHEPPAEPASIREYQRVFGCPVYFNKPVSALVLSADALRLPLATPDVVLQGILEHHARRLMEQQNKPVSVLERARIQLRTLLHQGNASRETLAELLGISARHLYRQLDREGQSYQRLLDELRLELANQYLSEGSDNISIIAERLKFTESQSFIRWFRKASGQTPGQFRKGARRN